MAEINFELYNNTLIQQLVGPQDSHLRLLEKILGVEIGSFGNQMTIKAVSYTHLTLPTTSRV